MMNRKIKEREVVRPPTTALCMLSRVLLFATPRTIVCQASLSIEFSRKEYWSGLPLPIPGDLPNPGIKPLLCLADSLAGRFLTLRATWEAHIFICLPRKALNPLESCILLVFLSL